jgi:hydroxymethylpyrimidine/phosphomethylpyrimidine kinase
MTAATAIPRVLSIAGTDPTGGAGIQADLKSIAANGGYGMAVVTALVAQNTRGVRSIHLPPVAFLTEQLDAVSDDVQIDAVKIGMLASGDIIRAVSDWLVRVRPPIVVLDPVMVATSGDRLLDEDAERALRDLLAEVHVVTPNLPELAVLAGEAVAPDWATVLLQAERVSERHGVIVLAKGGHLGGAAVPDALVDASGRLGESIIEFSGDRIDTTNTHGTGCSLSAALATRRVNLGDWTRAVAESKRWLTESIRHGEGLGVGSGNGPISHFAGLWERGGTLTRPDPAEIADEWWEHIGDVRTDIDDLPFVRGLGDGTLSREAFVWYLAQDALYLREYSRVLSEASRLAPTLLEQSFWAAAAHGAIATELQLHESWIPEGTMADVLPSATTTGYLNHLLAAGSRGDYAVLVAALLPCFWLYHDVGTRLQLRSNPQHPYLSWLDTYADEGFAESNRQAIEIVTQTASRVDPAHRLAMRTAFLRSAEHERAFFAAPL